MKRHTHSHTHGERILIDEIAYASALRQVSPMWKIFVSLYSLFLCLFSHTWVISVLILCAMLIAMTAIGKTRWHHIIRLMQIPLAFVILGCIMILLQVSHHGEKMLLAIPVGSWYFGVTAESVHQFGQVFLQCLAAVSCLYFLSTSTPMTELFTALRRMHIPGFLVEMMELVYRYIFVLLEAASQIRNAQECRLGYATLKTGFYSTGQLISNLFLRAYRQADWTYTAMESRGYTDEVRTLGLAYETKGWQKGLAVGYSVLLTAAVLICRIGGSRWGLF